MEIDQYSDPSGSHWTSLVSASDGGSICLEGNKRKWSIGLYTADIQNNDWTENYSSAFGADEIRLGEWQHVAGVWDGVELRLYLDGRLEGTKTEVEFCSQLSEGPFFVGADPADWHLNEVAQGYLHGLVRSVRISHGVEYTASFSPPGTLTTTPKTLLSYDFTIDTGRYAVDRSGHGRHGIIVGRNSSPAASKRYARSGTPRGPGLTTPG